MPLISTPTLCPSVLSFSNLIPTISSYRTPMVFGPLCGPTTWPAFSQRVGGLPTTYIPPCTILKPHTLPESAAPLATAPPPEHATTTLASGPAPHCAFASVHAPISSSAMPTRLCSTSAQRAGWCGCAGSDAAAPPTSPFLFLRQQTGKLHKAALPVWCFLDSMVHQSPTKRTEI